MSSWRQHSNGQPWRVQDKPNSRAIEIQGEGIPRTEGAPISAWTLWQDHGLALQAAACRFSLPLELLVGIICCEAVRESPDWWRFDARSYRREPGGELESGGLMQTLVKTARAMNKKHDLYQRMDRDGNLEVELELQDLLVAERSIMLGAAYLDHLRDHDGSGWARPAGNDPMLLCAAYNAGGVYTSKRNRWHLRTYGTDRLEKFASYYNDFLSLGV